MPLLKLLLSLLSCQTPPENWVKAWDENPNKTALRIAKLDNPIAQLAAVVEVTESRPEQIASLCEMLTDTEIKTRCDRINQRPHLWAEVRELDNETEGHPLKSKATKNPLAKTPPKSPECPTGKAFNHCADKAASMASRLGQPEEAAAFCNSIESKKWRGECFFQAAEAALERRAAHGYGEGVSLCLAASPFEQNCQSHLIMALAKRAPSAHRNDSNAWVEIREAEGAVKAAWSWRDKDMATRAIDRLWSEAIAVSYAGIKPVTGDPTEAVDTQHQHHIRAAIMRRLMQIDSPDSLSLDDWVTLGETAWMERQQKSGAKPDPKRKHMAVADLWPQNSTPPTGATHGAYMATSRRIISKNVKEDWKICALEAAARMPPHHEKILADGAKDSAPHIKWTAKRLLNQISTRKTAD